LELWVALDMVTNCKNEAAGGGGGRGFDEEGRDPNFFLFILKLQK